MGVLERAVQNPKNPQKYETVKYLLEQGADASDKRLYNSALRAAITNYDLPCIKLLVEYGADVKDLGYLYVNTAVAASNLEIPKYLIEHGMLLNERSTNDSHGGCSQFFKFLHFSGC